MDNQITISARADWFALDGHRVPISQRSLSRAVLQRLIQAHKDQPGAKIDTVALVEDIWADPNLCPLTGANRLYGIVHRLRQRGLKPVLKQDSKGYYLAPEVTIAEQAQV